MCSYKLSTHRKKFNASISIILEKLARRNIRVKKKIVNPEKHKEKNELFLTVNNDVVHA